MDKEDTHTHTGKLKKKKKKKRMKYGKISSYLIMFPLPKNVIGKLKINSLLP